LKFEIKNKIKDNKIYKKDEINNCNINNSIFSKNAECKIISNSIIETNLINNKIPLVNRINSNDTLEDDLDRDYS